MTCDEGAFVQTSIPMFRYSVPVVFHANPRPSRPMTPRTLKRYGLDEAMCRIAAVTLHITGDDIKEVAVAADNWTFEEVPVFIRVVPTDRLPSFIKHDGHFYNLQPADCYKLDSEKLCHPTQEFITAVRRYIRRENRVAIVQPKNILRAVTRYVGAIYDSIDLPRDFYSPADPALVAHHVSPDVILREWVIDNNLVVTMSKPHAGPDVAQRFGGVVGKTLRDLFPQHDPAVTGTLRVLRTGVPTSWTTELCGYKWLSHAMPVFDRKTHEVIAVKGMAIAYGKVGVARPAEPAAIAA